MIEPKDIEKNIKDDCCIYSSIEDLKGLTHDVDKELDKDKQRRDKGLISAEFGTRFRKLNTDNNKEESKR